MPMSRSVYVCVLDIRKLGVCTPTSEYDKQKATERRAEVKKRRCMRWIDGG